MNLSGKQVAKAYVISISIWCGLSLLTGWQYRIFDQALNLDSSFFDMMLLAEARGFTFALLTPPIFFIVRRYIGDTQHRWRHLFACCIGVVPFMLIYAGIRWILIAPWDVKLQRFVPRSSSGPLDLIHSGFADYVTIYIALVIAAHAYAYFERVRTQEMERYEYQQALAASELEALKMQLHPHFLFNTLHGIATLIDSDRKSAKVMILKLSSLLRTALQHSGSDLIPLQEELKFIGEYLDLEKMRFGNRLTVIWTIAPASEPLLVPQLILQPLVENAIRHGVAASRENGWVEILSRTARGQLELRIRNTVGGKRPKGNGVGLQNTQARLRHLYSDEANLSFAIDKDQIAIATVLLPALSSMRGCKTSPITDNMDKDWGDHAHIDCG